MTSVGCDAHALDPEKPPMPAQRLPPTPMHLKPIQMMPSQEALASASSLRRTWLQCLEAA